MIKWLWARFLHLFYTMKLFFILFSWLIRNVDNALFTCPGGHCCLFEVLQDTTDCTVTGYYWLKCYTYKVLLMSLLQDTTDCAVTGHYWCHCFGHYWCHCYRTLLIATVTGHYWCHCCRVLLITPLLMSLLQDTTDVCCRVLLITPLLMSLLVLQDTTDVCCRVLLSGARCGGLHPVPLPCWSLLSDRDSAGHTVPVSWSVAVSLLSWHSVLYPLLF